MLQARNVSWIVSVSREVLRVGRRVGLVSLTLFAFGISDTLASFMLSLEYCLQSDAIPYSRLSFKELDIYSLQKKYALLI